MIEIKTLLKKIIDIRPVYKTQVTVNLIGQNDLLKGRCAIITGGTSGIGFAIAKAFVNAGANVVITGRNIDRVKDAVSKLPRGSALGYQLDNSKIECFETIFQKIQDGCKRVGFSQIDILVNNAGVNSKRMPNATEEDYDLVLDTNLKGTFFLSQLFGKYLITNDIKGNILNISSASALRPADSAYTVSKWGIRGLTAGLAKALGAHGITVNGIAPGPTATPMMVKEGEANMYLERIPLHRYIMPEEIAQMAVIFVSDMGRSVMGDILYMTGGAGNLTVDDVPYKF